MRGRHAYPTLDPRNIADHVEGGCYGFVIKPSRGRPWKIEFHVQLRLDKQVKDHDLNLNQLRNGLWLGFDGENRTEGWRMTRANIRESTLTLHGYYRPKDFKRLQTDRKIRIAPRSNLLLTMPAGVLLEVRNLQVINEERQSADAADIPF
jgi:hypothetical protein